MQQHICGPTPSSAADTLKYYHAPSMPANIYVGQLQTLQLTGMKYYLLLACQLTYICPPPRGAAESYEILPLLACQRHICSSGVIIFMESCDHGACAGPTITFCP